MLDGLRTGSEAARGRAAARGRLVARLALAPSAPMEEKLGSARPTLDTEPKVLAQLAAHGVPVVPGLLATSAEAAVEAAPRGLEAQRYAMKIVSPDIAHKTEAGGVELNVEEQGVAAAYEQILAAVRAAQPQARIDGVLVTPMRGAGVELFVGDARTGLPRWP